MNDTPQSVFLEPGTVLGGIYQIIRLIGQGGMGTVYLAYDSRLDLKVAIKVISPELSDTMDIDQYEIVLKRFKSEAQIVAKIDHPNVIRIFGFLQDNVEIEGRVFEIDYLVMELLAGRTLRDTMDVSGFEYEDEIKKWISTYMIPVLEGLEKVHSCGIIHRDIKPENFFMKDDIVKLADFGLSRGFDLPSVTDSVADIFGTMKYMAPEQFYNFKLAREPADIFAIGRILYEIVEGKMSDKMKPFKQVHLSNPETEYLKALNSIILDATAEMYSDRIATVKELKDRLLSIQYCSLDSSPNISSKNANRRVPLILFAIFVFLALGVGAAFMHYQKDQENILGLPETQSSEPHSVFAKNISHGSVPKGLDSTIRAKDNSILHLISPVEIVLPDDNPIGEDSISIGAYYMAENPVTNHQYVNFLNTNLDRIEVVNSEVLFEGEILLKLSEKIRGYKPVLFDGKRFRIQYPMHSSCAILLVTGHGAEVYAQYYGLRLIKAKEWYSVMLESNVKSNSRVPLPSPVINYTQDTNGLRAINQIAEWGKIGENNYIILGQSPSNMIESDLIVKKDRSKYYTDTSFRVAKDAIRN